MENIKVSVLIYVRNDCGHIERCIKSVLNQTLREIEVLIVDGGSTDGTRELAEQFLMQDSRIRVIRSMPGVGRQFNLGVREAKGEYIGICESDDYVLPEMYQEEYEIAKQYQLDIVRADFNRFFEHGGEEVCFSVSIADDAGLYHRVLKPKVEKKMMRAGSQGFWSGIYRRGFLLEQGIVMNETPGAAYQDMGFSFLSTIKAERVMLIKQPFYCYRMDNPNSSENSPQKLTMVTEEYHLLKKRLLEENLFEEYKEWYFFWKVSALLWFYSRLSGSVKEDYTSLLYQDIDYELKAIEYSGSALSFSCREIVNQVKESYSSLRGYLRETNQKLSEMEESLKGIGAHQTILIFGNGNMGRLLRCYLEYSKKKPIAYVDNNRELWGKLDFGLPVMEVGRAVEAYPEAVYMIANINAYDEIRRQLFNLQIKEENIIVCNNYEKILVCLQKSVMKENGTDEWI